jgi:hypothetical protein
MVGEPAYPGAKGNPMNRKPVDSVAPIRRDLYRNVRELYALSHRTPDKERALKLARSADLLIEALACELYRLR